MTEPFDPIEPPSNPVFLPPPPGFGPEESESPGVGSEEPSGNRWLLIIGAIIGILVLVAGLLALLENVEQPSDAVAGADEPATSEPFENEGEQTEPFESPSDDPGPGNPLNAEFRPDSVAVGAESVWVSDFSCGVVVKIDPQQMMVESAIDLGGSASGVTFADGSVWVGNRLLSQVTRLDPATTRIEATIPIPGLALGLAAGDGTVWAVDPIGSVVYRIDPATNEVAGTIGVGLLPHHIVFADGIAWVANNSDDSVSRIDTAEDVPTAVDRGVGAGPLHVTVADDSAWVTNSNGGTVSRLDSLTGRLQATIEVSPRPHALASAEGSIWVGTEIGDLWRIDPATNEAELVPGAEFDSIDMAVDGSNIWVADADASEVVRFDAASAEVSDRIDLAEFGDCETFRNRAVEPPITDVA